MLRNIDHPRIIKVLDYVIKQNTLFVIKEKIEGINLFEYSKQNIIKENKAVEFIREIQEAMSIANKYKIKHGNLDFFNIYI